MTAPRPHVCTHHAHLAGICIGCPSDNAPCIGPAVVADPETYYFGCVGSPGHYWRDPTDSRRQSSIEKRVGRSIHPRIDGGFCPGSVPGDPWKRTRSEVEGEAAVHHVDGWTILAFWDRSVDKRGACNSNFVALGEHDFAAMCEIAQRVFPRVWNRYQFAVRLAS